MWSRLTVKRECERREGKPEAWGEAFHSWKKKKRVRETGRFEKVEKRGEEKANTEKTHYLIAIDQSRLFELVH